MSITAQRLPEQAAPPVGGVSGSQLPGTAASVVGAPANYRLRLPGPVNVPERIREAGGRAMVAHRGPEFRNVIARCEAMSQPVLGTQNRVHFFASTGTGMMEAAVANIAAPGERVLAVVGGQFGERFALIAKAYGLEVDTIDVPWGEAVDPAEIEKRIRSTDYRAVLTTQNESSTGVVTDLVKIGKIVANSDTLLVTDAVSSLGGIEMKQDEWGVDVVVSASQKALMCPPGVGLVSLSSKAMDVVKRDDRLPRFYWDFRKSIASTDKSETPFTSVVSIMYALHEALTMIHEEGLGAVLDRHRRLSMALRSGCAALGLKPFGTPAAASNTVVALEMPGDLDGARVVQQLSRVHRTIIGGSNNRLRGKVIRIGTMGAIQADDILIDLLHLERTMEELGVEVPRGEATRIATESLVRR